MIEDIFKGRAEALSQRSIEKVIKEHSRSFYFASILLPKVFRYDVRVVYAWCRLNDDAIDEAPNLDAAKEQLSLLQEKLERVYAHVEGFNARVGEVKHDQGHTETLADAKLDLLEREMVRIVAHYSIPRAYFDSLLAGMWQDTQPMVLKTVEELVIYAYRVAGVVGLVMAHIMGVRQESAVRGALQLGVAMQLTNIARDIKEDWGRSRRYVPAELDPALGDYAPPQHLNPSESQALALKGASLQLLSVAEKLYDEADQAISDLPPGCRPAIRAALIVYRQIGRLIARGQVDPLERRSYTTAWYKVRVLVGSLLDGYCMRARQAISQKFSGQQRQISYLPPSTSLKEEQVYPLLRTLFAGDSLTARHN